MSPVFTIRPFTSLVLIPEVVGALVKTSTLLHLFSIWTGKVKFIYIAHLKQQVLTKVLSTIRIIKRHENIGRHVDAVEIKQNK